MKKNAFLILLAIISIGIYAQKNVNVDNSRFTFYERLMPTKPQNPMFFYYATIIKLPGSVKQFVDEESLYNRFKIEGQRVTDNPTDNDIIVTLTTEGLNIIDSKVEERVVEEKDKEGRVTKRLYYYWVVVTYNFESEVVATKGGKIIAQSKLFNRIKPLTFKSDEYDSYKAAAGYWNNNKEILRERFTREVTTQSVDNASSFLSTELGFPVVKDASLIKTIDEKKHPENDALRTNSDLLKSKLESLNGTTPLTEEDLADIIAYFKSIPEKYTDPKQKSDVKLRYVAYYNLCRIYLFLDQPEKVKPYADLLFENDFDKKDAERLQSDAQKLLLRLNASEIKSRQFNPDSYFKN